MTPFDDSSKLCLASQSPRRRALLDMLGVSYFVRAAGDDIEEAETSAGRGGQAEQVALGRARLKGESVARALQTEGLSHPVLSSDTVVHIGEEILDKPRDVDEARSFLNRLSGTEHGVVTAVWLRLADRKLSTWRRTMVRFANLTPSLIEAYIATGEPFDKAGGYGIQGVGGALVSNIDGCYFTVMGLPVYDTANLLTDAGIPWGLNP